MCEPRGGRGAGLEDVLPRDRSVGGEESRRGRIGTSGVTASPPDEDHHGKDEHARGPDKYTGLKEHLEVRHSGSGGVGATRRIAVTMLGVVVSGRRGRPVLVRPRRPRCCRGAWQPDVGAGAGDIELERRPVAEESEHRKQGREEQPTEAPLRSRCQRWPFEHRGEYALGRPETHGSGVKAAQRGGANQTAGASSLGCVPGSRRASGGEAPQRRPGR